MEVKQPGPGFFAEVRGVGLADIAASDDAYAWHDYAHSRGKIAPHLASKREKNACRRCAGACAGAGRSVTFM